MLHATVQREIQNVNEEAELYATPKMDRLKVGRDVIPLQSLLQPTDFVYERHFESRFKSKSWKIAN